MAKQHNSYYFKGTKEEIINAILSLLLSKEFYREASLYSNFINNSHPEDYRDKIKTILNLMQKDNLILIRENHEDGIVKLVNNTLSSLNPVDNTSETAEIYIRQHGKEVLSEGGVKKAH